MGERQGILQPRSGCRLEFRAVHVEVSHVPVSHVLCLEKQLKLGLDAWDTFDIDGDRLAIQSDSRIPPVYPVAIIGLVEDDFKQPELMASSSQPD